MLTHRGFARWENGQIPLENGEPPAGGINENSLLPKSRISSFLHDKDWLLLMEIPSLLPPHLAHTQEETCGSQIPNTAAGRKINLFPVSARAKARSQGFGLQ